MLHDAFAVRCPSIDAEGEVSSRCAHVSGSERSADTSSLASFETASRTHQVTAATPHRPPGASARESEANADVAHAPCLSRPYIRTLPELCAACRHRS